MGGGVSGGVGKVQALAALLALGPLAAASAGCEKAASGGGASAGGSGGAVSAAGGSAAGGGSAASATRTYTLYWTVQQEPPGGVKVAIDVPAAWQETRDPMGGPSFGGNGLSHGPDVVLLPVSGADAKAKVETLVGRQYEAAALAAAERKEGADGSVWIASKRADGYVDARRFLAAGGEGGVVVCVVTLTPAESSRLPELEQICSTLRLAQ